MNVTKLKERGFSLVEVLVATAILSVTVIGFLTFVEDNRKSLNSANERTDFQNMAMKFKEYFDSPNRCKDFFDATAGIGNHFTIDMTAAMDADNNNAFSNSILLKNYNFEEMTLIKSHLPSNPFTDGTMVDGDIENFFIKIGVKASRNQVHKSFSGDTRDLFKRYFTIVFHLKRDAGIATLDGCHIQGSKNISMKKALCHNIGGIFEFNNCKFPLYGGGKPEYKTIHTVATDAPIRSSLSDLLCELEKRVILIENQGAYAISNTSGAVVIPAVPPKGNVTKYCSTPQGEYPSGTPKYFE